LSQQAPPFTDEVRDDSSSSHLSQDSIVILRQFGSQEAGIEQYTCTPRYSFQDYCLLHFADADDADSDQNTELFHDIDDVLNPDAIDELMQKMKVNAVRGYLQR
jgi:hypothetical protein